MPVQEIKDVYRKTESSDYYEDRFKSKESLNSKRSNIETIKNDTTQLLIPRDDLSPLLKGKYTKLKMAERMQKKEFSKFINERIEYIGDVMA